MTFDATPPADRPGARAMNIIKEYFAAVSDSLNFVWDRYVLTFGLSDQLQLFEDMFAMARQRVQTFREKISAELRMPVSRGYLSLLALLVAAGAATIVLARRRRPLFDVLARHLALHGIQVGESMTMEEALRTLRESHPDAARELEPVIALYEEERFSGRADRKRAKVIRRRLAELRV